MPKVFSQRNLKYCKCVFMFYKSIFKMFLQQCFLKDYTNHLLIQESSDLDAIEQ